MKLSTAATARTTTAGKMDPADPNVQKHLQQQMQQQQQQEEKRKWVLTAPKLAPDYRLCQNEGGFGFTVYRVMFNFGYSGQSRSREGWQ